MSERINIEQVNHLSNEEFVARFGSLYEHSPWVAEAAYNARPFGSLEELHGAMVRAVDAAPEGRKMDLILSHPELAGEAAAEGTLTPESTREQTSAGLDGLTPEEYEAFHRLNAAYKEKFGFPLITAVREHTKETLLSSAEARLENPREEEIETALSEIAKIAHLRLQELVEPQPGPGIPTREETWEGGRA